MMRESRVTSRLPPEITTAADHAGATGAPTRFRLPPAGISLEAVERDFVRQSLEATDGNQTRAAQLLGISRDALRYRMQKFGLLE